MKEVFKELKFEVPTGKGFLSSLLESSPPLVEENFPLHQPRELASLGRMLSQSLLPFRGIHVDRIRDYFGRFSDLPY